MHNHRIGNVVMCKSGIKYIVLLLMVSVVVTACQESRRERFEREAREFTKKNCPRAEYLDIIYLDSLVCHNDGNDDYIAYYSVRADSMMLTEMETQHDELHENLLKSVRNSVDLRHVKEEGLNIIYVYYNADTHEKITEFRFMPEDYR